MSLKVHKSYQKALGVSAVIQALVLSLTFLGSLLLSVFALVPAVAYWLITPIVIFRHPQPTELDLKMVRTGYAFYFLMAMGIGVLMALLQP